MAFLLCVSVAGAAAAGPIAAGNSFNVVAMPDGTVVAWGINGSGQLGQGNTQPKAVPTVVPGLTSVVAVAAGSSHAMALTSGGLVYTWGANSSKQLGNGTTTASSSPVLLSLTGIVAIAAGDNHSVALANDGSVWVWGSGQYGQLGINSTANVGTPTQIAALSNVTAIAAGGGHTMVRKSDSTVWVFGWNAFGQLAQGNTTDSLVPVQISGVTTATGVAAGTIHSVVLLADGTVKAAGYNISGQVGDGTTTQRTSLQPVTGLTSVSSIVAGGYQSGAIRSDGSLRLWGGGGSGQLGTGNGNNATTAATPLSPSTGTLLSLGNAHTLAVTSTGVVYSFGSDTYSELGDGTTQSRSTPDTISGTNYTWKVGTPTFNVNAGTYNVEKTVTVNEATPGATIHYTLDGNDPTESDPTVANSGTLQIDQTRTLKAKAWNGSMPVSNLASAVYTLQVATPTFSPTPTTYTTPQTVSLSTTSPGATLRYTVASYPATPPDPTASSPAYTGPMSIGTSTTIKVAGFRTGWTTSSVNSGTYTMNFGTIAAPGVSPSTGSYTTSVSVTMSSIAGATIRYTMGTTTPADPTASSSMYTGPINVTTSQIIKARAFHSDYTPASGSAIATATYTIVAAAPTFTPTAGSYAAGTAITIATATTGATIRYTTTGIDPTDTDPTIVSGTTIPVGNFTLKAKAMLAGTTTSAVVSAAYTVTGSVTTAAIDAGDQHAVAVRSDGSVFAWGDGGNQAIGDGQGVDRLNPILVSGLSGITQVSAGTGHTLARRSDGSVLGWGVNTGGRLGDGTTTQRPLPVFANGITTATAVAAGADHSLVLLASGTVMAFGDNSSGQLGLGDTTSRSTPTAISGLSDIVAIAAGNRYSLALTATGTFYAWGTNGNGQLGLGDQTQRNSPTLIASLSGATAIGTNNASSAVLLSTGAVKTFGFNMSGQLGNNSFSQSTSPVSVSGLTDATAIAVGVSHMLARRADGTLVAWGLGSVLGAGPLGLNQTVPIAVPGLANIAGISAGGNSSYAWTAAGEVWSFGSNLDGRLGDSTLTDRYDAVPVAGPGFAWKVWTPTLSIAAGTYNADQNVTVTCTDPVWAGVTTLRYTTNGLVPTETDPTVSCGGSVAVAQSLMLRVTGWRTGAPTSEIAAAIYTLQPVTPTLSPGTGNYGSAQSVTISSVTPGVTLRYTLDGSEPTTAATTYSAPVSVSGTGTVKAVAFKAGWTPSTSGAASYWIATATVATPTITPVAGAYTEAPMVTIVTATPGATIRYTVDGSTPTALSPRYAVPFMAPATTTVKAKAFLFGQTASAVATATFSVDAAGAVATPTLSHGGGRFVTQQTVTVTGAAGATLRYTTTGVDPTASDTVVTSGGVLTIDRSLVLKVRAFQSGLTNSAVRRADFIITGALVTGNQHTVALKGDGSVWAWGRANGGLVGDGQSVTDRLSPVSLASAGPAVAIAAGPNHSLVALATGAVKVWGSSSYGALGTGLTQHLGPTAVPGLTDVIAVAAGTEHSLAVTSTGQLYAWGRNNRGQLGFGDTVDRSAPTLVPGVSGAVAVAAGNSYSLVLTTDGAAGGRLWAFGANDVGQLAEGTTQDRRIPIQVPGLNDVISMEAGASWALVRTADGRAWSTGTNAQAQRGLGHTIAAPLVATALTAVAGADIVSAGDTFAVVTDRTNRYWYWGNVINGQGGAGAAGSDAHLSPFASRVATAATNVAIGWQHALTSRTDGTVWSTGLNTAGCLGTGSAATVDVWTSASGFSLASNAWLESDPDGDGLSVWREHLLGTDPLNADSNGDGIPDGLEASAGTDPAQMDVDGDGLSWVAEARLGTDPYRADTDGDSVSDALDMFPLDPTRSAMPPPTTGDTTPPAITLIEPTNATPVP